SRPTPATRPCSTPCRSSATPRRRRNTDMAAVSFVADDLTGAAAGLAPAHLYGLDAVLVVGGSDTALPTDVDVVGIAGPARSLGGEAFDELVRAQLAQIA